MQQEYTIELFYDDRYDMRKLFPGYRIWDIKQTEAVSRQVKQGQVTNVQDSAVIQRLEQNPDCIHACGIGQAEISLVREETVSLAESLQNLQVSVKVSPAPLTLLFLAGQDNAEGLTCGEEKGAWTDSVLCERGQVYSTYAFTNKTDRIINIGSFECCTPENVRNFLPESLVSEYSLSGEPLAYPLYALTEDGEGKAGMDAALASEWNRRTGNKVWVVNVAVSQSSAADWAHGKYCYERTCEMYMQMRQLLHAETQAGHIVEKEHFLFWQQGELDGREKINPNRYRQYFLSMYRGLRQELNLDALGIVMVRDCAICAYQDERDLLLGAPRRIQYGLQFDSLIGNVYIASNVNEQWISDEQVKFYFQSRYKDGKFTYALRKDSLLQIPEKVTQVHADLHYMQVAHNENGRTAAEGLWRHVYQRFEDVEADIVWKDQWFGSVKQMSCSIEEPRILMAQAINLVNTQELQFVYNNRFLEYSPQMGMLFPMEPGETVLSVCDKDGRVLSMLPIEICSRKGTGTTAIVRNNGIEVSWEKEVDADAYRLYRKTGKEDWTCVYEGEETRWMDTDVIPGNIYYYGARKHTVEDWSDHYEGYLLKFVTLPKVQAVRGTDYVRFRWNGVDAAELYIYFLFRQMEDGSYSEIFKTADVQEIYEFVDTGLVPNQTYAYRFGMYDLELHGQSVKIIL